MYTIIELEDNGQDFLELVTNHVGIIIDAKPFQKEAWEGGIIPIFDQEMCVVGESLPIHKPPHINFGFLKHNIKSIKKVESYEIQ
jgi:hypothetical protein